MIPRMLTKTALFALTCVASLAVHAGGIDRMPIDIPAGQLDSELKTLAKQAGVGFFYKTDLLTGLKTPGVKGMLSPREAVAKLLEGTQLTVQTDSSSGAMLITLSTGGASTSDGMKEKTAVGEQSLVHVADGEMLQG